MARAVIGLDEIIKGIEKRSLWVRGALVAALYQEGLDLDAKSVRLCPVDTGRLRSTHFVSPPVNKNRPRVEVGYGTNYALYVHEDHKPFLRTAAEEAQTGYEARLAKRTWDNFNRKITSPVLSASTPKAPKEGAGGKVRKSRRKKSKSRKGGKKKS